jgi:hypothetical protein
LIFADICLVRSDANLWLIFDAMMSFVAETEALDVQFFDNSICIYLKAPDMK